MANGAVRANHAEGGGRGVTLVDGDRVCGAQTLSIIRVNRLPYHFIRIVVEGAGVAAENAAHFARPGDAIGGDIQ